MNDNLKFESPSFIKRLKGMLGVDFYRLFHTPLFYIFLGIAAIIPALVSMGFSKTDANGQIVGTTLENIWIMVAAKEPLYSSKFEEERAGLGFTIMEVFTDSLSVESTLGAGTKIIMKKSYVS